MLPADDPSRDLTALQAETDAGLPHVALVGHVYTILLAGEQTGGRYALVDIFVPPEGGPPPHRHDFEEIFHVLEGEALVLFRGARSAARTGATVNIPANAPHAFRNVADRPARLLCMASPPGLEQFFLEVGDRVATRTGPLPVLDEPARAERLARAMRLVPIYKNEFLPPP